MKSTMTMTPRRMGPLLASHNPIEYRRILALFVSVTAVLYLVAAWFQFIHGRPLMASVNGAAALVMWATLVLLRSRRWTPLAAQLGVWAATCHAMLLAVITGATSISVQALAPAIAISAAYLLGNRDFRRVMFALSLLALYGMVWPLLGFRPVELVTPATTVRFLQVIAPFILMLVWITSTGFRLSNDQIIRGLLKQKDKLLRKSEEAELERHRSEDLIAIATDGFWETDAHGVLTMVSSRLTEKLDRREADLLGKTPWALYLELVPDANETEAAKAAYAMKAGSPLKRQRLHFRNRLGKSHLFIVSGRPWHHTNGDFGGYRGVFRDETELERRNRNFQRLSEIDPLTGVRNRRVLRERMGALAADPAALIEGLWLAYLDLDGFKQLNDTDGHAAGDRFLVNFAACLTEHSPPPAVVARMGGDEFCVVLPAHSELQVRVWAETIISQLSSRWVEHRSRVCVTTSIGLVQLAHAEVDVDWWMQCADESAYEAKRAGGSRYVIGIT